MVPINCLRCLWLSIVPLVSVVPLVSLVSVVPLETLIPLGGLASTHLASIRNMTHTWMGLTRSPALYFRTHKPNSLATGVARVSKIQDQRSTRVVTRAWLTWQRVGPTLSCFTQEKTREITRETPPFCLSDILSSVA